jgi:hypothetical protein
VELIGAVASAAADADGDAWEGVPWADVAAHARAATTRALAAAVDGGGGGTPTTALRARALPDTPAEEH